MAKRESNKGAMAVSHETIVRDQACVGCGYNLKGLPSGSLCPECGRTIATGERRGKRVRYDTSYLGDAPRRYLLVLRLGLMVSGISGIGVIAILLLGLLGVNERFLSAAWFGLALTRLGGLAVVFQKRPEMPGVVRDASGTRATLKLAGLGSQAAFVLIPGLFFLSQRAYEGLFLPLMIVGLVGAGLVAIVLSFVADWATDTPKANRLRAFAWMLIAGPIAGVLVWAVGKLGFPAMAYIYWIQVLGVVGALFAFAFVSLTELLMVSMVGWAILASEEKAARDARLLEKARKFNVRDMPEAAEEGFALAGGGVLGGPGRMAASDAESVSPPVPDEAQPGLNMHRVKRSEDVSPYGLEGDGPEKE